PKKFLQDSASRSVVTPPAEDPGDRGLFTIQVSSFEAEEGANRLLELLRKAEAPAYILPASVEGKTWYRVRVGQYTSRSEAERAAKKVRDEQGLPAYVTPSQS
ncbi:MAG: SPOR domain-containing protein, partial [Candidatus Methylomirabilis sp.]|nr:SPOR domain-containing protein [Deltaproteobacteria bacterium]